MGMIMPELGKSVTVNWVRTRGLSSYILREDINNSYGEFPVHLRNTAQFPLSGPPCTNQLNQHKNPKLYRRPPVSA